ncbi:MAG: tRNA lysidine(34) synthetase TilS [Elusimicrobia bacterium]|nr:tRNA lysidine(34) synthetase TilS [Elusimicrobiota bacterium]
MAKQSFHARVWAKLIEHDRRHRLLERGDRVLAAVSGGPDSVCLADFLIRLGKRRHFDVLLLHAHHGLRGREADRDARLVSALGRELGAPVVVRRLAVRARARRAGRGLEDAGRALRYEALAREARRLGCGKIATGHQLDDQAETVLLHLLRGTKSEGLAGIPVRRPLAGTRAEVVRPLLAITRSEVLEYVRYRGLRHATDSTNRSEDFLRNWVRLKALPLLASKNPRVRENIAAIAEDVARLIGGRGSGIGVRGSGFGVRSGTS